MRASCTYVAQQPGVEPVRTGVDVIGKGALQPRGGLVLEHREGRALLREVARIGQRRERRRDELVHGERRAPRDPGDALVQRLVARLAHPVSRADVQERVVLPGALHRGCIVEPRPLVQANPGVVIPQLQCVAQEEVEQRRGRTIVGEARLRIQRVERRGRGVEEPAQVVAPVGGRRAQRLRLRHRDRIHHPAGELVVGAVEDQVEDRGILVTRVTERRKAGARLLAHERRDQRLQLAAETLQRQAIVQRLEMLGVPLHPIHRPRMQPDHIEQQRMGSPAFPTCATSRARERKSSSMVRRIG
ncbi:MAG: hypothetical protein IPN47_22390 [Gemmatimonadetes bacterium]|nr:hypothetical protein [Gemmatimonadota bacterium]